MKRSLIYFFVLIMFWADTSYAKTSTNFQTCRAMAYVDAGHAIAIRTKPAQGMQQIAKLHDRQYLCVLTNQPVVDGWTKVKAVPFANGKNTLCLSDKQKGMCGEMANFAVKWLSKKPMGSSCKLTIHHDFSGSIIPRASGRCATGWLPSQYVHYFAD